MLQEAHVAVEQGVGRRQDPYRLHPRPPLRRALHRHVGKAGEAEVGALTEVAVDGGEREKRETEQAMSHEKQKHCQMAGLVFSFFWPGNTFSPTRRKTWGCILILPLLKKVNNFLYSAY